MSDVYLGAIAVVSVLALAAILVAAGLDGQPPHRRRRRGPAASRSVAVGTVQAVADSENPLVVVEVESVNGQRFTGRLCHPQGDPAVAALRPGLILLVSFDPQDRDRLSLADDVVAVRAAVGQTLVRQGVLTDAELDLIRHGTRSSGVITGMRAGGYAGADLREVELDVMVSRRGGGQFPAHQTTVVPAAELPRLAPGSIIDAYYRPDDESTIAVCVPPA
ncbi:MAG: hypothetical protein H6522_09795 [Mycolicibacterium sp.]|nr:hypothetical protein [Mycobacterium sp.]MCB9417433.1 hypothetical protein [Mycolicibacterium sp.]